MTDISENNKRIAKNTIFLYFRTMITMLVGLYTGRIMLQALGVENYGINSVVGGIVSMSSLITGSMSVSISRYLTYGIGAGDKERMKRIFSTSVNVQIIMAFLVVAVLELVGVWFLNTQANIPLERMGAANWVLQCSIISLVIGLLSSPYNALIIAHEKMDIYAYMSIVDVILKLSICFIIMAYGGDRLKLLSLLTVVVAIGMQLFYTCYCRKKFDESEYKFRVLDKSLLKELTVFSGWNLFGNTAWVFNTQGISMLVNIYYGVTFNAARGLAMTVNNAVQGFIGNFTTAFSPQITKSYASGDIDYAINLANRGTKFTWLMMYVFIVPICLEADMLLKLWLGEVPEMAGIFLRLAMFESLAVQSGNTLLKLIQANGNIKRYQIEVSLFGCIVFPFSWIAYELGAPVWSAYLIFIIVYFAINIIRYIRLKSLMPFSIKKHLKECLIPCILVSITSFIIPVIICSFMDESLIRFIIVVPISVFSTIICSYIFGLSKGERIFIKSKFQFFLIKIFKR